MDRMKIIEKMKRLRAEKELSLSQLATVSGLSKGYLSKIENGIKFPPVTTLHRIASALEVDLTYFFSMDTLEGLKSKIAIVRKNERKLIGDEQQASGIIRYPLADHKFGPNMHPFIIELPTDHYEIYKFEGEEFHYIISGKVEFFYGEDRYILEEGDFAYFDADVPYTGRSLGSKPAKILMTAYYYKGFSSLPYSKRILKIK